MNNLEHMEKAPISGQGGFKENRSILYAYRNRCPICNVPFDSGKLAGGFLSCVAGHRYDVKHAGLCPERPSVHLDPFPLLVQDSVVKVALNRSISDATPQTISQKI